MRGFVALVSAVGVAMLGAAGSGAASGDAVHLRTSNHWQGTTFVTGLESCDLLGATAFPDVDLTDEVNITYTMDGPLFVVNGRATVHGLIDTPSGRYRVTGQSVEENGVWPILAPFIGTSGHVTISGPNGVVSGSARFQDLTSWGPPEFDLLFDAVTDCHLR